MREVNTRVLRERERERFRVRVVGERVGERGEGRVEREENTNR